MLENVDRGIGVFHGSLRRWEFSSGNIPDWSPLRRQVRMHKTGTAKMRRARRGRRWLREEMGFL
jgi:hypothetical protein